MALRRVDAHRVDAPLEGGVWIAFVVACVSAGVYMVPGARTPLAPAVPLLAAGSFLLGAFVVGWNASLDNDSPMQIGFFLMGAGALATTMVAAVLAARVPAGNQAAAIEAALSVSRLDFDGVEGREARVVAPRRGAAFGLA